ncbi:MAG: AAA family ATPase [Ardenticatenia bacterium]|nr:AAA family ATPase [Ardenticatenia bacterium]
MSTPEPSDGIAWDRVREKLPATAHELLAEIQSAYASDSDAAARSIERVLVARLAELRGRFEASKGNVVSAPAPRWTLRSIRIRDLLGFQGEERFEFGPGIQVVEAGNHTGKSSLAMGLLWGLTGQIPALDRLNRQSYRLSNRHAGENAQTKVVITLEDTNCRLMEIRRPYAGRTKGAEDLVELTIADEELTGVEATARIKIELGVGQSSLEGCGVVLQDHRLKLITGSDISEVINDMLGLEALSEVVPMLESQSKEADQLRKEIDAFLSAGSPLKRWNEENARLEKAYQAREDHALKRGFAPEALEDPGLLANTELAALAGALQLEAPAGKTSVSAEVERQRQQLTALRKATPRVGQLSKLTALRPPIESALKRVQALAKAWVAHDEVLSIEAGRGALDIDALVRTVVACDEALARIKALAEEKEGTQRLLEVAYQHLLEHPAPATCPLCESKIDGVKLGPSVRARIDADLATEIERLTGEETDLEAKKEKAAKRRDEVRAIKSTHSALMQGTRAETEAIKEIGHETGWSLVDDTLLIDPSARAALLAAIEKASEDLGAQVADLKAQEEALLAEIAQQEEKRLRASRGAIESGARRTGAPARGRSCHRGARQAARCRRTVLGRAGEHPE